MIDMPFYSHEPDSRIAVKKDMAEVNNWSDDLEYVNEELEYLLDIEHQKRTPMAGSNLTRFSGAEAHSQFKGCNHKK